MEFFWGRESSYGFPTNRSLYKPHKTELLFDQPDLESLDQDSKYDLENMFERWENKLNKLIH